MPFITLADLQKLPAQQLVEREVEGLGKIKVARFSNEELIEQSVYLKKLQAAEDSAVPLKIKYSMVAVALRNEDGSRMFKTIEEGEAVLSKMAYEQFMLLFAACVMDVNELNDEKILERAKKSLAAQSTDATA